MLTSENSVMVAVQTNMRHSDYKYAEVKEDGEPLLKSCGMTASSSMKHSNCLSLFLVRVDVSLSVHGWSFCSVCTRPKSRNIALFTVH